VQEGKEGMCYCGQKVARIYLLGERKESLWMVVEVGDIKYSLGIRQVVFGQVGIEACFW
jgi:hypothetical protein